MSIGFGSPHSLPFRVKYQRRQEAALGPLCISRRSPFHATRSTVSFRCLTKLHSCSDGKRSFTSGVFLTSCSCNGQMIAFNFRIIQFMNSHIYRYFRGGFCLLYSCPTGEGVLPPMPIGPMLCRILIYPMGHRRRVHLLFTMLLKLFKIYTCNGVY